MFVWVSPLLLTGLAFQTAQVAEGLRAPASPTPSAPTEINPEVRGDIMMARKQFREAIEFYKTGANTSPILANKLGIAYHQTLDLNNAQKWYEKAVKLNPRYPEAINNLGTVYYARKSYRRAVETYKKALRISPESASILANLGTAYFARKDYADASKTYSAALALDPEVFERRGGAGGTVLQERSVEERAKFHFYLAKTYAHAGSKDRALQYIRMCIEEGFKDREKFVKDPEFATLQEDPEFQKLLTMEQKVL